MKKEKKTKYFDIGLSGRCPKCLYSLIIGEKIKCLNKIAIVVQQEDGKWYCCSFESKIIGGEKAETPI
jgi:hypothetical protein